MKAQKDEVKVAKNNSETVFTVNEELNKYKGPEFEPPKLKGIREKFSKGIIIHR